MKKEKKGKHFIQKPRYEGGMDAMKKFIGEQMIYPKEAQDNNIAGVVKVKFTINHKGKVIEAKVLHKLGYGCDKEAIRLVKLLTFIIPKNKGLKVLFHRDLNIHFSLGTTPTIINDAPAIQYQYTQRPVNKPSEQDNNGGYSYTINLGE